MDRYPVSINGLEGLSEVKILKQNLASVVYHLDGSVISDILKDPLEKGLSLSVGNTPRMMYLKIDSYTINESPILRLSIGIISMDMLVIDYNPETKSIGEFYTNTDNKKHILPEEKILQIITLYLKPFNAWKDLTDFGMQINEILKKELSRSVSGIIGKGKKG